MKQPNAELPQNLRDLLPHLSLTQAVPLGTSRALPLLAVKIPDADEALLETGSITCEFKPSVFNVDFQGDSVAVCFVQFRLNGSNARIYTAHYDLANDKQFSDVFDLLAMKQYGLLVCTTDHHDFLQFDVRFEGDFDPRDALDYARRTATDYPPLRFREVVHGLSMQGSSPAALWEFLDAAAPFDKRWYARLTLESEARE